ncbi:uncharacterized protein LOC131969129 [Centropristis striata]|uniref:uncharacterized protein LOC131969129 n=1 Tax=Centropristis striata TaxID=184440 RepID=UPI0027E18F0D|nr:uncharacterized protein LOC131969129 [Centropristis striata]
MHFWVKGQLKAQSGIIIKVLRAKAASLSSVVVLLDLSAAFDTMDHQILISTLHHLGVSGSALSLLKSYLKDRTFRSETRAAARIFACLADISQWMSSHHLKLNLGKTELLYLPGKGSPTTDFHITVQDTVVASTETAKNLGVTLDHQLSLSTNITGTTRSCRFLLHNIRRIRPFLTQKAAQVLVQALVISRLDYCNSLMAGLPAKAIRPLQLIQNAAARLVFNLPKFSHTTPLLRSLHWLPVAARIRFKTLALAYSAANGSGPTYIQDLVKLYTPARPLRSASAKQLATPTLCGSTRLKTTSRLFSVLAPKWWNELPTDIRTSDSLYIFRRRLKTYLFQQYLG